jgi:hypothetical protein
MSALPPALAPWAPQLAALTDELSVALGRWLADITDLLAEYDNALSAQGEPDGFDGLSRRGTPHRLLVSEWLWATEEPAEFLRRAAENELLHMAPAFRQSAPRARVAVLCDCGPGQWGPARLVQLAALLVMHRRADAHGAGLTLGILGDEPGKWRHGDLEPLLKGWQQSRHRTEPDADDVDSWVRTLAPDDEVWLLGGGDSREWTQVRQLSIAESAWDSTGAVSLSLSLAGRHRVLSMPPRELAVSALRGAGFRVGGRRKSVAAQAHNGALRYPVFPNGSRVLIGRGTDDRTVVTVTVPDGRPRRHRFSAPVVAAGLRGRRLIALTLAGSTLRPHVVGRPMPLLDDVQWSWASLPPALDGPLAPLYPFPEGLLAQLSGSWIVLDPDRDEPGETAIVAATFGQDPHDHERPRTASLGTDADVHVEPGERILFGHPPDYCSSADGRMWTASGGETLVVPDGDQVVGMTSIAAQPAVVSRSAGGQILRLITAEQTRTLTRWSTGSIASVAVHPSRAWLAVSHLDGRTVVADLSTGERLCELRWPS